MLLVGKINDETKSFIKNYLPFKIYNYCRNGSLIVAYNLTLASDLSDNNISYAVGFIRHYLEDNNNTLKVGNITTQVLDVKATIGTKEGKITSYIDRQKQRTVFLSLGLIKIIKGRIFKNINVKHIIELDHIILSS